MEKKKVAVVYDTSYLMGEFQSIKQFILSRRFSSQEKQGLLGFLKAKQTVYRDPNDLFSIVEVVPTEVIRELDNQTSLGPQKLVVQLLQEGAIRVDLAMDTVVSELAPEAEMDKQLGVYAERLVSYATRERYALAIVAAESDELLANLDELAKKGKDVFGVKSEHLRRTRLLHDKLTEIANRGTSRAVVMEN